MHAPLYRKIYLSLHQRIIDGTYPFGAVLPSEHELAEAFGVSRITSKRALDELAAAGFVTRKRGSGTVVTFRPPESPLRLSVEGLLEDILKIGLSTGIQLVTFAYVPASETVAATLECDVGATVQHAIRIRTLNNAPFSHITTYVPEDVGRCYDRAQLSRTQMLILLERAGFVISRADQTVRATLAEPETARHLKVEIGSPLLRISRVVRDQNDRPIQYIVGLYPPDRYEYRMALSRAGDADARPWTSHPAPGPSRRRTREVSRGRPARRPLASNQAAR